MNRQIDEYIELRPYTSFRLGGRARYFAEITDSSNLPDLYQFAEEHNLPSLILGGGTNMIVTDRPIEKLVLKMGLLGLETIHEDTETQTVKIGAGELWDSVVERTVTQGLSGIEAMSGIPGTAGAAPIQNIGAYGQEIKDTIFAVEVYDTEIQKFKKLSKEDCHFSYRSSIFKTTAVGRFVVTNIILKLSKHEHKIPQYPSLTKYLSDTGIIKPSLEQIRKAVLEVRRTRLPNPKYTPNVGSFFKNPIVPKEIYKRLKAEFPDMPSFLEQDGSVKLSAGWLLEYCGFKGKTFGNLGTTAENALVITNNGNTTYQETCKLKELIINAVYEKFGVPIEPEPIFVE